MLTQDTTLYIDDFVQDSSQYLQYNSNGDATVLHRANVLTTLGLT